MTHEEMLAEKINGILRDLGEHFDAIQILGTYVQDDGMTARVSMGIGNWYARQGVAQEFLNMDAAVTTAHEIGKVLPRSDSDDGDDWKG
jgi:hypothetical protein